MSARAGAITRSCYAPCRSPRCRVPASWSRPMPRPRRSSHLIAGMVELVRQRKLSSLHVNFPHDEDFAAFAEAGFLQRIGQQFHWTQRGLPRFRRLSRGAQFAQAQGGQEGAARGAGRRHRDRPADRLRPHRKGLGRVLPALPRHHRPQMGFGLPDPPLLLDDRRADARQRRAVHGAARAPTTSPAPSTFSAATRSTAATGGRTANTASCISSAAITGRSSSPSSAA